MTTLTVRSEIGEDGKLRLEVPCALPPGPVEVVLVVQASVASPEMGATEPCPARPRDPGLHRARSGLFVGKVTRNVDIDAITDEMNAEWKTKLADLEP